MTENHTEEQMSLEERLNAVLAENAALKTENNSLKVDNADLSGKFGMRFPVKPEFSGEIGKLLEGKIPTLRCNEKESYFRATETGGNTSLIKADNLIGLLMLKKALSGKVNCIYTDPPYNTGGGELSHNDKIVDSSDAFRSSKWASFMHPRLTIAHDLLAEDGVIMIAIDDNEHHHLRMLLDDIFGRENFIADVVWQGGRKNDSRFVSVGHDYMVIYAKNKQFLMDSDVKWRERKPGVDEVLEAGAKFWKESGEDEVKASELMKEWMKENKKKFAKGISFYDKVDGRGVFSADNLSWPGGGGPEYDILHPDTGKAVSQAPRGWLYQKDKMDELLSEGRIYFGKDEKSSPRYKRYLHETTDEVAISVFEADRSSSNRLLAKIIGKGKFKFPKDHNVLARWINMVTRGQKDALILDFFAGSGSTGHAVAQLNAEDGGTRNCILITNNENEVDKKTGVVNPANGIAHNVTAPRMRNVLSGEWADGKTHDALPGSLTFYELEWHEDNNVAEDNPYSDMKDFSAHYDGLASLSALTPYSVSANDVDSSLYPAMHAVIADNDASVFYGQGRVSFIYKSANPESEEPQHFLYDDGEEEFLTEVLSEVSLWSDSQGFTGERTAFIPEDGQGFTITDEFFNDLNWTRERTPLEYVASIRSDKEFWAGAKYISLEGDTTEDFNFEDSDVDSGTESNEDSVEV